LVEGVTSDPGTPTVTVQFLNSTGTVLGTAGTTIAGAGKWRLNTVVALPTGATRIRAIMPSGAVSIVSAIVLK
jgi:hypothetical protein